ncbi:MAG: sporulation protein YqfD [Roseburia intestinalis]
MDCTITANGKCLPRACLLFAGGWICHLSGFGHRKYWKSTAIPNLSEEVVLCFLSKEHASFGTKKKNIDCAALEETLRSRYPEVIWTSIKIYGTKMTVDIQENLLPEENYEEKKEETAHDIVAADDGLITEMITRSGTPAVTVGTPVLKKGRCVSQWAVEISDDDGETAGQYLYRTSVMRMSLQKLHIPTMTRYRWNM